MKKSAFVAVMLLLPYLAICQSPYRIGTNNTIGWYNYFGDFKLSPKIAISSEYNWRRGNLISLGQQDELRVGLNYKLTDNVDAQLGYIFADSHPFGAYPSFTEIPEHRIYGQVAFKTKVGKVEFGSKLRYENRQVARQAKETGYEILGWNNLNKFRYEVKAIVPLKNISNAKQPFPYLLLYDEIHIGFGQNVGYNIFDQNRVGVCFGYRFNPSVKLEVGYIQQIAMQGKLVTSQEVMQYNNGLQVNLRFNGDWSKKGK